MTVADVTARTIGQDSKSTLDNVNKVVIDQDSRWAKHGSSERQTRCDEK